jgi:hypothetical protein
MPMMLLVLKWETTIKIETVLADIGAAMSVHPSNEFQGGIPSDTWCSRYLVYRWEMNISLGPHIF